MKICMQDEKKNEKIYRTKEFRYFYHCSSQHFQVLRKIYKSRPDKLYKSSKELLN